MSDWERQFILDAGPAARRGAILEYLANRRFSPGGFMARVARKNALYWCARLREARAAK